MKKTLIMITALLLLLPAFVFAGSASEEVVDDVEGVVVGETLPGVIDIDYSSWERGRYGGRLVTAFWEDIKTLNPFLVDDVSSDEVTDRFLGNSIDRNPLTLEPEPQMAESWTVSDDEMSVTVRIKRGLVYSDGTPITAHDFVFGVNHLELRAATGSTTRETSWLAPEPGAPEEPPKYELIDAYTYKMTLPTVYAQLVLTAGLSPMPRHIVGPIIGWDESVGYDYEWEWGTDEDGNPVVVDIDDPQMTYENWQTAWGLDVDPADIVSSGPFLLKEYLPSERIVLERNPNYHATDEWGQQLPYLDEVVWLIVPDGDTELQKFRAGELDIYNVRGEDYAVLVDERETSGFKMYSAGPSGTANFVTFNMNPIEGEDDLGIPEPVVTWFNNQTFRRAVSHLIDRTTLINTVVNGIGYPAYGFIPPQSPYYWDGLDDYAPKYNPARAAQLLDSIDYIDRDGDGFREDPDGNKITWEFNTNVENNARVQMTEIITQDMRAVGLDVEAKPQAFNELVNALVATYDWEMIMIGLGGGDVDPVSSRSSIPSNAPYHMFEPNQTSPRRDWEAEIDRLWAYANNTTNEEQRKDGFQQIEQIWVDQAPWIYTFKAVALGAAKDEFGNYKPQIGQYNYSNILDRIFVR